MEHKEDTGICGAYFKMETLNNTNTKISYVTYVTASCGVTGAEVVCCDDEEDGWMDWTE